MTEATSDAPAATINAPADTDGALRTAYPSMFEAGTPPAASVDAAPTVQAGPPPAAPEASEPDAPETAATTPTAGDTAVLSNARIEIALPEGFSIDAAALATFDEIATAVSLDSASAQKLLDLHVATSERFASEADAAWNATQQEWRATAERDPELGGAGSVAFREHLAAARSTVDRFGGPALKQVFDELGIGDHPELVKFCARIGKALAAGTAAQAKPTVAPARNVESDADAALRRAYPSMFK
jgi:hypothetical protein